MALAYLIFKHKLENRTILGIWTTNERSLSHGLVYIKHPEIIGKKAHDFHFDGKFRGSVAEKEIGGGRRHLGILTGRLVVSARFLAGISKPKNCKFF